MQHKIVLYFIIFSFSLVGHAQEIKLTPQSEISVLTAGSGSELYSSFGHSAFRVKDQTQGIDVVYNYGTFDFTTPNFYTKFARGKLDYTLARQRFDYFLLGYEQENRWVNEQILNLSLPDRMALFEFLERNYLPENRDYKYDFFYNNCATKIWDVLQEVFGDRLVFEESYVEELYTHRQLIRQNVPINSWSGFGIDLALGSVIDDVATAKEHMFLPEFIMRQMSVSKLESDNSFKKSELSTAGREQSSSGREQSSAESEAFFSRGEQASTEPKPSIVGAKPLSASPETLFENAPEDRTTPFLLSPGLWLSLVCLAVLLMTYMDYKSNTRRRWLDFLLFFVTGAVGTLIVFLWFFTDHSATAGNLNILWAFPLNLVVAFIAAQKKGPNWVAKYAIILLVLIGMTLILWLFGLQIFSPLMLLVWLATGSRYLFLFYSYQTPKIA